MLRLLPAIAVLGGCLSSLGDTDAHCPAVTGLSGVLVFCPADADAVGDKRLELTLGKGQDITVVDVARTSYVTYANVTSDSAALDPEHPYSDSNQFALIPDAPGDGTVSVIDRLGGVLDRVAVHVAPCDGHLGESGKAMFCGALTIPLNGGSRIAVFAPSFGRQDFTRAYSTDDFKAWVSVDPSCDPAADYCTNVFDVIGEAPGKVDVGVFDANGDLDQVTVDVIESN